METKVMKLADIVPADYNPRVQLNPGDTEYEALRKSIQKFGLVEPLIVNSRNNVLIGGHQRMAVLKDMGVEETEVIAVDLDDQQEKTLNIALNKIEGDWDYQKLEKVIADLTPEDYSFTGFSDDEIDSIIGLGKETEEHLEAIASETESAPAEDTEDKPGTEFDVYLSFPTKDEAEDWLRANNLSNKFEGERSMVIRMEE